LLQIKNGINIETINLPRNPSAKTPIHYLPIILTVFVATSLELTTKSKTTTKKTISFNQENGL
jgi:hypothetical protein